MADRVVYGNTHSENGWIMVDERSCKWKTIPGSDDVNLLIRAGQPEAIMTAYAADINAYVQRLRDDDSACWTAVNDVGSSNHLSGTAMDLNWRDHAFRIADAGFNPEQIHTIRELLDFYEGMIFWGNDWESPKDAMHWQMGYATFGNQNVAKVNDFIRRKIRPDGYSTFRREGQVPSGPPSVSAVDVLARATGISHDRALEILPQVSFALIKANCNNPRRIAAALAQWVIESGHFRYTEEIASGNENLERWKYKGRTWIQLTWLENYRGFGQWCNSIGLVQYPDYFVDYPHQLAEQKWAALGPAYWWAIKYPQINEYADRGDIDNVSKWVNAPAWVDNPNKHANGEKERRDVYNTALSQGDQLLSLTTGAPPQEDELADPNVVQQIAELHAALRDSVSMYATGPGQETSQAEAFGWDDRVEACALRGEDWALSLVRQAGDGTLYGVLRNGQPDQFLVDHARAVYRQAQAKDVSKV